MSVRTDRGALRDRLHSPVVRAHRLDVNGVDTYVMEAGSGPPLVLMHGGIECGGAYWEPVIAGLAKSFHLVIPDAPGLGESAPAGPLDPPAFGGWLSGLLEMRCPEPPVLVAHSLFGTLAARFAIEHGHLLRRLVIWSAPAVGRYRMPIGLAASAVLMGIRPSRRNIVRFARWPFHDLDRFRRTDPEWFDLFISYLAACGRRPDTKRTMRHLIRTCTKQIPPDELRAISVPTTVLWGSHDRMTPYRLAESVVRDVGWPLHTMSDTGHVPHLEQPENFVAAVRDIARA
jgi:pimeloyl-ACP methyl ester carboxylesterase